MKRTLFVVLALLFSTTPTYTAPKKQNDPSHASTDLKLRVWPRINFSDSTAAVFKQCVFRELRKIPEVVVVENDDQENRFELEIVGLESTGRSGTSLGFVAAVNVAVPFYRGFWERLLPESDRKLRQVILLSQAVILDATWVAVAGSVDALCKNIIAEFDTKHIEPIRQGQQNAR